MPQDNGLRASRRRLAGLRRRAGGCRGDRLRCPRRGVRCRAEAATRGRAILGPASGRYRDTGAGSHLLRRLRPDVGQAGRCRDGAAALDHRRRCIERRQDGDSAAHGGARLRRKRRRFKLLSTAAGSTPSGSTAAGSTPAGSTTAGSTAAGATVIGTTVAGADANGAASYTAGAGANPGGGSGAAAAGASSGAASANASASGYGGSPASEAPDPGHDSLEALGLGPSRLTITFGFGAGLFEKDGKDRYGLAAARPAALVDLPRFNGDQLVPARTGGDLSMQACADDPQVAFHAVRAARAPRLWRGAGALDADRLHVQARRPAARRAT